MTLADGNARKLAKNPIGTALNVCGSMTVLCEIAINTGVSPELDKPTK